MVIQVGNQHSSDTQDFIPYPHADFKHLSEEAKSSLKGPQIYFTPVHVKLLKGRSCGGQHYLLCHV